MAYTIQQQRLVSRAAEELVRQRDLMRRTAQMYRDEIAAWPGTEAKNLSQAKTYAASLRSILTKLFNAQGEIQAACTALGMDYADFTARWAALDQACTAIESATAANIAARLQAIVDGLPAETLL